MSQVQLEAFFLVQNACTAFPSTLVSMLELFPPLPILPLLRVAGLSGLNTIIVGLHHIRTVYYLALILLASPVRTYAMLFVIAGN
jgi:hypothetical protein